MNVGSVISMPATGRIGVVVGAAAVGETADGKQRVVMQVKSQTVEPERGNALRNDHARPEAVAELREATGAAARGGYQLREARIARDATDLTAEEKTAVDRLRQRDAQVRQEEQAHAAAAGAAAGPITYTYATGPDGRQYAVGGSVSVRISNPSGDPEEYARAAARLSYAANAAHNPSAADLAAARKGYQSAGAALAEIHRNADVTV